MDPKSLSDTIKEEILALCQSEQTRARAEGRDDVPDCGCLGEAQPEKRSWFWWL